MDPEENLARQIELATDLVARWQEPGRRWPNTERQAQELAQLVLDLAAWREKGGFLPHPKEQRS